MKVIKFSFENKARIAFQENSAIEDLVKVLSLNEEDIKRRKEKLEKYRKGRIEARQVNDQAMQIINDPDGKVIKLLAEDQRNLELTFDIFRHTFDSKMEKLKEGIKIFADIFINFDLEDYSQLVKPLSKWLFHGKSFYSGEIMEATHTSNLLAFFKNISFGPRIVIVPVFRHPQGQQRNTAIKEATLASLYQVDKPLRMIEAVRANDITKIDFYIQIGVDIDLPDKNGDTALHWALRENNVEIAKLLISRSANPLIKNKQGKSAMQVTDNPKIKQAIQRAIEPQLNRSRSKSSP